MSALVISERRRIGPWAPWAVGALTGTSALAHFVLASQSTGMMALFMVIGGLLCLWCTVHPLLRPHNLRGQTLQAMVISSSSAVIHMGVITAHASAGGRHHGAASPVAVAPGDHLQMMLGLVGFELFIVMMLALVARTLTDPKVASDF